MDSRWLYFRQEQSQTITLHAVALEGRTDGRAGHTLLTGCFERGRRNRAEHKDPMLLFLDRKEAGYVAVGPAFREENKPLRHRSPSHCLERAQTC